MGRRVGRKVSTCDRAGLPDPLFDVARRAETRRVVGLGAASRVRDERSLLGVLIARWAAAPQCRSGGAVESTACVELARPQATPFPFRGWSLTGPGHRLETSLDPLARAWPGRGDNTAASDPVRDANGPREAAMIVGGDPERVPASLLEWDSAAQPTGNHGSDLVGLHSAEPPAPCQRSPSRAISVTHGCLRLSERARSRTLPGFGAKSLGIALDSGCGGGGRRVAIAR